MRVSLRRTGGFANIALRRDLDTHELPSNEAALLQRLIAAASGVAPAACHSNAADAFRYHLTVTRDDGRSESFEADDTSMPDPWRPLVDWLLDFPP